MITTTAHDPACSAVVPCTACYVGIENARDARHAYNKALNVLDDLASMPWVLFSVHGDSKAFHRAYDALRALRDEADRLAHNPDNA